MRPQGTGSPPSHWDAAVLARVEAVLARHVGPLAAVMVRRAARECPDLPALYARLGEQITQSSARAAFLGHLTSTGGSGGTAGNGATAGAGLATGGSAGSGARPAVTPTGSHGGGPPVSDAMLELAQKLLAAHVGPIARVVVKRAAERSRQRDSFFAQLADAVPESARAKFLAELSRLAG